jgi:hypothetical protein
MAGPSDTSDPSSPGGTGACHLADAAGHFYQLGRGNARAAGLGPDYDPERGAES